ncbi:hypothetical protein RUM44_013111 [Polyplax serrata]|uniref:Sushi domain-containing protein n=1 Tax=Polyplax serrata TaxID=468196 RepID=A0ABR1BD87_POLSC
MYLNTFVVWKSVLVLVILTEFSGSAFVFAEKNCPLLRLEHGRIRYKFRGRNVRFNCMRGYQLVGAKYASCMNGKWDANVPICVRHGCIVPSTTRVNGQFIESYRGAVVKIICNPGYNLFGSPSVYCNGYEWNETFPVCKGVMCSNRSINFQ